MRVFNSFGQFQWILLLFKKKVKEKSVDWKVQCFDIRGVEIHQDIKVFNGERDSITSGHQHRGHNCFPFILSHPFFPVFVGGSSVSHQFHQFVVFIYFFGSTERQLLHLERNFSANCNRADLESQIVKFYCSRNKFIILEFKACNRLRIDLILSFNEFSEVNFVVDNLIETFFQQGWDVVPHVCSSLGVVVVN